MLIALAFAHFSSELLLKEQMIISVKKTLNNAGHINAKLIDFSELFQKKSSEIGCFYWLFLAEVSLRNFEWNRPIFLRIRPWKSSQIWLFFAEIPRNRPIFPRILTFFPRKSREIGRFFREFDPENPAKFCFFFRAISEALIYSKLNKNMDIQVNLGTLATVHLIWHPPCTCFTVLKEKHHFWQSVFTDSLFKV